jgi:hypothetical protein
VHGRSRDPWFDSRAGACWTFAGGTAASFAVFDGEPAKSAAASRDPDIHFWSVEA